MPLNETLHAVSDPVRRRILEMLRKGAMNAGEIAGEFSITDAAISRHLSVLKKADLVRCHRKGKFVEYELNATVLDEVILWAASMKGETDERRTETKSLADNR